MSNKILRFLKLNERVKTEAAGGGMFIHFESAASETVYYCVGEVLSDKKLCLHRRESPAWMDASIFGAGEPIPYETQFLMLYDENSDEFCYVLPLVTENYRCSLYSEGNRLWMIAETGDSKKQLASGRGIYVACGKEPYDLIFRAHSFLSKQYKSFSMAAKKKKPKLNESFGWCSWNAFYDRYNSQDLIDVADSFFENGVPLGFMIMDDGWQSVEQREQFSDENFEKKFLSYLNSFHADKTKFPMGLKNFVSSLKKEHHVKKVFVWHLFSGTWLGSSPLVFSKYNVEYKFARYPSRLYEGAENTDPKRITEILKGFYPSLHTYIPMGYTTAKIKKFFHDFHKSLSKEGIDGVKIDSMANVEGYGERVGGRVKVTSDLVRAAENTSKKFFRGNTIYCSALSNDFIFNTKRAGLVRTSMDFDPLNANSNGRHLRYNAYVTAFLSNLIQPDWDMFQTHTTGGDYHAAVRAMSGGPIYCADEKGKTDFSIIKKLVDDDGLTPHPVSYAKPIRRMFYAYDGKQNSAFILYNENKYGKIIGIFDGEFNAAAGDIKYKLKLEEIAVQEDCVVYDAMRSKATICSTDAYLEGVIPGAGYTLLTVVPFKNGFAVVGCTDKYNSNAFVADIKVNKKSLRFRALASGEYFAICIGDCAVVTKNEYSVRENQFRFVLKKNETVKILCK